MQPLKMSIEGSYYDSQIYSGRLYLWHDDGSIEVVDWDRLIDSIKFPKNLRLAVECGFRRSDYLYGHRWSLIFGDQDIRSVITRKFEQLAETSIVVNQAQLTAAAVKHQDNPMPFPHADSLMYRKTMYTGGKTGIYASTCRRENKYPVSTRPTKHLDAPVFGLSASYSALALSSGSEGLFELDLGDSTNLTHYRTVEVQPRGNVHRLSQIHSTSCRWTFQSIFSSSHHNSGYIAEFEKTKPDFAENGKIERTFAGIKRAEDIFNDSSYSWGYQDKLCQIRGRELSVVRYEPWNEESRFTQLGKVRLRDYKGDVVAGDSALFGFIIECDNGIVVMDSTLDNMWIEGEPVNWRIFPRSKFYENQLHIVYDSKIDIYSFNDDYFVNQDTKKVGIKRYDWRSNRG